MSGPKIEFGEAKLIFPLPLLSYRLPDAVELNARLLSEIDERQKAEKGYARSNRKGWHSGDDFFMREEPAHRDVGKRIVDCISDATKRLASPDCLDKAVFELQGWINVNPQGAYNVPHDHPGSFWSGTYYVARETAKRPKSDDGAIAFLDSRSPPSGQSLLDAKIFRSTHTERPEPGTLLIFPSNLKHWVHPNQSVSDRVTLAFNAIARRKPA